MNCKYCNNPLNKAQYKGQYKSCPCCSVINGEEHVYFLCDDFGYTDARITINNPDGIQSYCVSHRANKSSSIPMGAKKCSEL